MEDQDLDVVLDRRRIHLFDSVTGEAVTHGVVSPPGEAGTDVTPAETDD